MWTVQERRPYHLQCIDLDRATAECAIPSGQGCTQGHHLVRTVIYAGDVECHDVSSVHASPKFTRGTV
jgi:hypothetical protein